MKPHECVKDKRFTACHVLFFRKIHKVIVDADEISLGGGVICMYLLCKRCHGYCRRSPEDMMVWMFCSAGGGRMESSEGSERGESCIACFCSAPAVTRAS